jgi:enterobacteria phage integrase
MPRRLPPLVECWRDRHGNVRVYYRKGKGQRIPLPASVGSEEFDAAYQAILAGQIKTKRERREPTRVGTIAALITSYLGTASFIKLRTTTKTGYGSRLEALRKEHGHRTVAGLTRPRIVAIMQPYADRPGAGLAFFTLLRILIRPSRLGGSRTILRSVSGVPRRRKSGPGPTARLRHSSVAGPSAPKSGLPSG